MNTDSTVLISKYLKEYNHIYKEANDIYHEIARKLQLSDSALDIFYTIFEIGDNCLQRDICKDRKSVVQGKSVDLGGRRIIKKIFFFQAEDGIRDDRG